MNCNEAILEYIGRKNKVESRILRNNPVIFIEYSSSIYTITIKTGSCLDLFVTKQTSVELSTNSINSVLKICVPEYKLYINVVCNSLSQCEELKSQFRNQNFQTSKNSDIPSSSSSSLVLFKTPKKSTPKKSIVKLVVPFSPKYSPPAKKANLKPSPKMCLNLPSLINHYCSPVRLKLSLVKDAVVCKEKSITQKEITDNLSIQQREIVEACCKSNSNVFFTGCAGTGKSYLTSIIIQKLCKLYGNKYVYVTATTGLAACAIDGVTIHQFAGISALREQSYSNNINSIINQV